MIETLFVIWFCLFILSCIKNYKRQKQIHRILRTGAGVDYVR